MRVAITGAAGFVGRHLAKACHLRGYEVGEADITTGRDARALFATDERYDLVLHCAATVGGRRLIDGTPAHLLAYNAALDAAMFDWALRTGAGTVVYYSSSAAYPLALQSEPLWPLIEPDINLNHPARPETSYGQAKLHGEQIARYARAEGLRVHVLRPFSGYGADQSLDYPWPSFVARARAQADPFVIWSDGTQVRDWIHIDDIVGATLAVVEQPDPLTLNLCTGIGTDFNTLAQLMTTAAGYSPRISHNDENSRGVDYRVGDPSALHRIYRPRVALEEAISWALG